MTVIVLVGVCTLLPTSVATSAFAKDKGTADKSSKRGSEFYVHLPDGHPTYSIAKVNPKKYKKWPKQHDPKFATTYKKSGNKNIPSDD